MIFVKFMNSGVITYYSGVVDSSIAEKFGNRLRVRVCGLCWENERLLMVNHPGLYGHDFWAPPGGGMEWATDASENLIREFKEETGLQIRLGEMKFVCEFISPPFHALELFFEVFPTGGKLEMGFDPELEDKNQVIGGVKFMGDSDLMALPENHRHGLFRGLRSLQEVKVLQGYRRV